MFIAWNNLSRNSLVDGTIKISGIIWGMLEYKICKDCTVLKKYNLYNLFNERTGCDFGNYLNQNVVQNHQKSSHFIVELSKSLSFFGIDFFQSWKSNYIELWNWKDRIILIAFKLVEKYNFLTDGQKSIKLFSKNVRHKIYCFSKQWTFLLIIGFR